MVARNLLSFNSLLNMMVGDMNLSQQSSQLWPELGCICPVNSKPRAPGVLVTFGDENTEKCLDLAAFGRCDLWGQWDLFLKGEFILTFSITFIWQILCIFNYNSLNLYHQRTSYFLISKRNIINQAKITYYKYRPIFLKERDYTRTVNIILSIVLYIAHVLKRVIKLLRDFLLVLKQDSQFVIPLNSLRRGHHEKTEVSGLTEIL